MPLTCVALVATLLAATSALAADLVPPTTRGPYNVGTTLFTAPMSGGRTARVQVFYPTRAEPDPTSAYTIVTPAGSFRVRSRLGAAVDAVAEPGGFPLIAHDHGGTILGADHHRVGQLPMHERMATHGFVMFLGLHSADRVARARDLSLLIDHALARSATPGDILHGSIDPERIGVAGQSAGGGTAVAVAAGSVRDGLPADDRIKAMVVTEPDDSYTLADAATISFPYMLLRGTQLERFLGGASAQEWFDDLFATTMAATPRIEVRTPDAVHVNYVTGFCDIIDQAREAALLADATIPEPLTTLIAGNGPAAIAFAQWNMGPTVFAGNGAGFGGGRNVCRQVGVGSVRSLDTNPPVGETDSPPLRPVDPPYVLVAPPPQEVMVELVTHYSIAFWKTFLEGDRRYMRYLAPGYAKVHRLPARVTIVE